MNNQLIAAVLIIMLAIGGVLASKALAFRGEGHGWKRDCQSERDAGPRHAWLERMAEVLDLTAEQRGQIEKVLASSREAHQALREKIRANHAALQAAGAPEGFDEAKIRTLTAEGGSLKAEMMVERAKTRQQIHALLTPEQQQLLEKIRPLLREGRQHGDRHHRFGHFEPSAS